MSSSSVLQSPSETTPVQLSYAAPGDVAVGVGVGVGGCGGQWVK